MSPAPQHKYHNREVKKTKTIPYFPIKQATDMVKSVSEGVKAFIEIHR